MLYLLCLCLNTQPFNNYLFLAYFMCSICMSYFLCSWRVPFALSSACSLRYTSGLLSLLQSTILLLCLVHFAFSRHIPFPPPMGLPPAVHYLGFTLLLLLSLSCSLSHVQLVPLQHPCLFILMPKGFPVVCFAGWFSFDQVFN